MIIVGIKLWMNMEISPIPGSQEVEVRVVFRMARINLDSTTQGASLNMLQAEDLLAQRLNEIGTRASQELLEQCDTGGEPLVVEGRKWTSKGRAPRLVETPHGTVRVLCHVYQTSAGGATRVPLEERARLVGSATPRMARMMASKLAQMNCGAVGRDMGENHQRPLSKSFAQDLGCAVGALATVRTDYEEWRPLSDPQEVATVAVGVDGAHLNTREEGWRQSMAGTLALYDKNGERLETLYAGGGPGATPVEGKAAFFTRMDELLERVGERYPKARVVGLSDGARDLQAYLAERCDEHLLDFHHAAEYLSKAGAAFAPDQRAESAEATAWAAKQRRVLRDEKQGAKKILGRMRRQLKAGSTPPEANSSAKPMIKLTASAREGLQSAVTYFANHLHCMDYAGWSERQLPIGSGVTEAACKTIIKQRMCQSGMRWSVNAADALISLRALYLTPSRWDFFWTQHMKTPSI